MLIHYRNIANADHALLLEIYRHNRLHEIEPTDWSDAQKDFFLQSQFELQQRHYATRKATTPLTQ
jgi:hypothetical protein